jgi:uncharacterized protein YcgI (DUF1989 family)
MQKNKTLSPRTGIAFILRAGQFLKIIDREGEQVADLMCFNANDKAEYLSSGRTIDYAEKLFLTKGDLFYSNRSHVMFEMVEDTVGRHDFTLSPCSAEMFRIIYGDMNPHPGCFGNLCAALAQFEILPDQIHTTFNVFMHVDVDATSGKISVLPPLSKAGDYILIRARMDLIVGLTACSAGMSNNFSFKPIDYVISD